MKRALPLIGALVLALGLAGCSPAADPKPLPTAAETTAEPVADGSGASMSDASAPDTEVKVETTTAKYSMTFSETEFNYPTPATGEGMKVILVSVTYTNTGRDDLVPITQSILISFVTADGFVTTASPADVPQSPSYTSIVMPGHSTTLNIPFEVPADTETGYWAVGSTFFLETR